MVYINKSFHNRFILYRIKLSTRIIPYNFFLFENFFQNSILPTYPPISKDQNKKVTLMAIEKNV